MIPHPVKMKLSHPRIELEQFSINGWNIVFSPKKGSLLSVRCLLQGGAISEAEGLAYLRDRILLQILELSDDLPVLTGELDITTSTQYSHISYDGLSEELDDVVHTINALCRNTPDVESVYDDCLQQISSELRSANDWPQNMLYAVFQHRCSELKWGVHGHYSSILKHQANEVTHSWEAHYLRPTGTLIVVGDLDRSALRKSLSSLPLSRSRRLLPRHLQVLSKHYFVQMDLEQTHLLMATPIIGSEDPQFEAWRAAIHILSGDIDGRIPKKLRVESGLTYDLCAFVLEETDGSILMLTSSVSDFERALKLINTGLIEAHLNPSEAEMRRALLHLNIEKIESLASCSDLSDRIEQQWMLDQTVPQELIRPVAQADLSVIQKALKHISSANWLYIALGSVNPLPDLFKTIDKPSSFD